MKNEMSIYFPLNTTFDFHWYTYPFWNPTHHIFLFPSFLVMKLVPHPRAVVNWTVCWHRLDFAYEIIQIFKMGGMNIEQRAREFNAATSALNSNHVPLHLWKKKSRTEQPMLPLYHCGSAAHFHFFMS